MNNSLVIFSKASKMLAEADTIQKAKELKDLALTAADWAKRKGMGEEAIQYARSYALEAERKMGQMLLETERNKGAKGSIVTGNRREPVKDDAPTLKKIGVSKKESSRAQKLASLPIKEFKKVSTGEKSITQVTREIKQAEIKEKHIQFPSKKYRVIYADPPWKYGNTQPDYQSAPDDYYPLMNLKEICDLPVPDIIEDDAVLFLWVTSPMLEEGLQVAKAWSFKYKAMFVWDKIGHNMGHYNSVRHELLFICVKGSCQPDVKKLYDSVQSIKRSGKHSEKPEEFRKIIDTIYPYGKRIELFARKKVKGWDKFGNE